MLLNILQGNFPIQIGNSNITSVETVYFSSHYFSPFPGVRDMNVTTRTKYCDTNACNNDIAEWRSSGGSHLGVNLLFYALLGSLFALM